jgi:hypothetical protein
MRSVASRTEFTSQIVEQKRHSSIGTSPVREVSPLGEIGTISNLDDNRDSKEMQYKTDVHVTPRQTDMDLLQRNSALSRPVAADSGEYESMMQTKMMKTSSGGFGANLELNDMDPMIDLKNTT